MYRLLLWGLLLCSPLLLAAQSTPVGAWYIYFGNQRIAKNWTWFNEVQYRNFNFGGDLEQLLLRTAVGYNLTEGNNNLALGYGFIHGRPYDSVGHKSSLDEHRVYQQFISRQQFGRFYLLHRYRIEERWIGANADFALRFRYFLSLNVPLNKPTMEARALYLSLYSEIFVGQRSHEISFDRERVYAALGYAVSKDFRVELGYMSQLRAHNARPQLQLVIFNNLPIYRPPADSDK